MARRVGESETWLFQLKIGAGVRSVSLPSTTSALEPETKKGCSALRDFLREDAEAVGRLEEEGAELGPLGLARDVEAGTELGGGEFRAKIFLRGDEFACA